MADHVVELTSNQDIFEVKIAGLPLKLRSSHDEDTVKQLVSLVDQRIQIALPKVKHGSVQTAALLVALNLAEELQLLKQQANREIDRLEGKAERIISSLEAARIPKTAET